MSLTTKLLIGAAIVLSATAYVAYLGAATSWQYYLTVDEYAAEASEFAGRRVRISGRVAAGSLVVNEDRSRAEFVLQGHTGELRAVCGAPLPDNLAEEMEVVVEGRLEGTTLLHGDQVLTRCASKYESQ